MIGVLTHHWAKAEKVAEAKGLLDRNGLAQSKAPGSSPGAVGCLGPLGASRLAPPPPISCGYHL